ncbi:hypothetical protein NC652_019842 [Populus alba x Populus x berolinensis]|nr:hypothetical protein NC652_019842 [Populus alba x Populus x berolinensis]
MCLFPITLEFLECQVWLLIVVFMSFALQRKGSMSLFQQLLVQWVSLLANLPSYWVAMLLEVLEAKKRLGRAQSHYRNKGTVQNSTHRCASFLLYWNSWFVFFFFCI